MSVGNEPYENEKGLEDIEQLSCTRLIARFDGLPDHGKDGRKKSLERFLAKE